MISPPVTGVPSSRRRFGRSRRPPPPLSSSSSPPPHADAISTSASNGASQARCAAAPRLPVNHRYPPVPVRPLSDACSPTSVTEVTAAECRGGTYGPGVAPVNDGRRSACDEVDTGVTHRAGDRRRGRAAPVRRRARATSAAAHALGIGESGVRPGAARECRRRATPIRAHRRGRAPPNRPRRSRRRRARRRPGRRASRRGARCTAALVGRRDRPGAVEYTPYTCFVMCMPTPLTTPYAPGSARNTSAIFAIACTR